MMKKMILTAMTASMIAACNTEKKPADDGLVFDASVKTQAELTIVSDGQAAKQAPRLEGCAASGTCKRQAQEGEQTRNG